LIVVLRLVMLIFIMLREVLFSVGTQDEENQHSNTEHSLPQNHKCRDADCAAITTVPFKLNVINAVMLSVSLCSC